MVRVIAFRRLSSGPTIPELMRTEQDTLLAPVRRALEAFTWHRLVARGRMRLCFLAAALILATARILLRLCLIEAAAAASAFQAASRLSRAGVMFWHHSRHLQGPASCPAQDAGGDHDGTTRHVHGGCGQDRRLRAQGE